MQTVADTPSGRRPRQLSWRKWAAFRIVSLLLMLGVFEAGSYLCISLMPNLSVRRTSAFYEEQSNLIRQLLDPSARRMTAPHPVLGWHYAANFKDGDNQTNAMALRSTREYTPRPEPGVLRIAAFGDSFVYGSEVNNANAWAALMESAHPDMEVLNYGVGGYGTDQAYLRYLLEGQALAPRMVLICFVPDDIRRLVNVYRRFLNSSDTVLLKPRYLLDAQGKLSLVETPVRDCADYERLLANPEEVRRFGEHDYWYPSSVFDNPLYDYSAAVRLACTLTAHAYRKHFDPERPIRGQFFNQDSTAFKLQTAIFDQFSASVREKGGLPVVVMLPDDKSVQRARQGEPAVYEPLLDFLRERGITYLDAAEAFQAVEGPADLQSWFAPRGHYSPAGNQIVASWLAGAVRRKVAEHDRAGKSP